MEPSPTSWSPSPPSLPSKRRIDRRPYPTSGGVPRLRPFGGFPARGRPRVKGAWLRPIVAHLARCGDQTLERLPPALHRYLEEEVHEAAWYPEDDHAALVEALGALLRCPGKDVWRTIGHLMADWDLVANDQGQVRQARPDLAVLSVARLWRLHHTSGCLEARLDPGGQGCRLALADYPFMTPRFARIIAGYCEATITLSGGRDPWVRVANDGAQGQAAVWHLKWS